MENNKNNSFKINFKTILIVIGVLMIPCMLLFGFFIFLSWDDQDFETLFVQKIEGSELLLVDYDVWYGKDGNESGKTILNTTKDFNFRKVDKLPFSFIESITNNEIKGIQLLRSDVKKVNETDDKKTFKYDTKYYKGYPTLGFCIGNFFKFKTYEETKDSLILFDVEKKSQKEKVNKIGFKKGNIKILSDSIGKILHLEIKELIILEKDGTIKKIEKNQKSKNEDSLSLACVKVYHFEPKSEIFETEFSDYGFYKELKKKNRPNKLSIK